MVKVRPRHHHAHLVKYPEGQARSTWATWRASPGPALRIRTPDLIAPPGAPGHLRTRSSGPRALTSIALLVTSFLSESTYFFSLCSLVFFYNVTSLFSRHRTWHSFYAVASLSFSHKPPFCSRQHSRSHCQPSLNRTSDNWKTLYIISNHRTISRDDSIKKQQPQDTQWKSCDLSARCFAMHKYIMQRRK